MSDFQCYIKRKDFEDCRQELNNVLGWHPLTHDATQIQHNVRNGNIYISDQLVYILKQHGFDYLVKCAKRVGPTVRVVKKTLLLIN